MMTPPTIADLINALNSAMSRHSATEIEQIVSELERIDTAEARAHIARAMGVAAAIRYELVDAQAQFERAISLFREINDEFYLAIVLGNIGLVYDDQGSIDDAERAFKSSLKACEEIGHKGGVAMALSNLGNIYNRSGDHQHALEHFHRSLELFQETQSHVSAAMVIGNIGKVYSSQSDWPMAMTYFTRALALHEELGDQSGMSRMHGGIGNIYSTIGDYPSALKHLHASLAIAELREERATVAHNLLAIGNVYARYMDHARSLDHFRRALDLFIEMDDHARVALCLSNIGVAYDSQGEYEQALVYYHRALAIHDRIGHRYGSVNTRANIAESLYSMGRVDDARDMLSTVSESDDTDPGFKIQLLFVQSRFLDHDGDYRGAASLLEQALDVAVAHQLIERQSFLHKHLRDLCFKSNDLAGYVAHNDEYMRITEESRGKEATQKMAMMDAERTMDGERRERDKERALLHGALPKSVADRMIRGEDVSGDHFEHAAILFVDVVSFTDNTSHMPPADVVKLLETIFRTIDGLCDSQNVVKVKTIGDSYMCFRGDGDAATNARSIANVALGILHEAFTWPTGEPLHFRAGIHIGPATAGVIGTQRLQYDVWGDTVNVASRMESTSLPGRIHVSSSFALALNSEIAKERKGETDAIPSVSEEGEKAKERNSETDVIPSVSEEGEKAKERNSETDVIPSVSEEGEKAKERNSETAVISSDSEEPGTWHLALRGETEVKGKGLMTTYWLDASK